MPSYEEAINSTEAGCSSYCHEHNTTHEINTLRKVPTYEQALLADHQTVSVIDVSLPCSTVDGSSCSTSYQFVINEDNKSWLTYLTLGNYQIIVLK